LKKQLLIAKRARFSAANQQRRDNIV